MGIGYQGTDRKVIDYDLWFQGEEKLSAVRDTIEKLAA